MLSMACACLHAKYLLQIYTMYVNHDTKCVGSSYKGWLKHTEVLIDRLVSASTYNQDQDKRMTDPRSYSAIGNWATMMCIVSLLNRRLRWNGNVLLTVLQNESWNLQLHWINNISWGCYAGNCGVVEAGVEAVPQGLIWYSWIHYSHPKSSMWSHICGVISFVYFEVIPMNRTLSFQCLTRIQMHRHESLFVMWINIETKRLTWYINELFR